MNVKSMRENNRMIEVISSSELLIGGRYGFR